MNHFGKLDPHQSGKLDPDRHEIEKQDPDPHESDKLEALEGHFGALRGSKSGKKRVVVSGSASN